MPYLILCLISALLAGGGVWKYQAQKHELTLLNLSTDYLKRDFRALENANAETTRLQNQKDEALRAAAQRQRFWQSQNSALERDVDGLRAVVRLLGVCPIEFLGGFTSRDCIFNVGEIAEVDILFVVLDSGLPLGALLVPAYAWVPRLVVTSLTRVLHVLLV